MPTLAFDKQAKDYDEIFTYSPIGILQRNRVYKFLWPLLKKNKDVLEINCGTGHDALMMAPLVHSVIATDIASEMIRTARRKKNNDVLSNVQFETVDINSLHHFLKTPFHLLFSNFAGLNCLNPEEIRSFAGNISSFIKPEGHLVFVLLGPKCLWENIFFYFKKDIRLNRRKTNSGVKAITGSESFTTYYYAPAYIQKVFSGHFAPVKIRPVGIFIPPSFANPYFKNKKLLLSIFNFLEKIFGNFSFLSGYADHYFIVLKKKTDR